MTNILLSQLTQKEGSAFQRFLKHFDWLLFFDILFLSFIGLIMVYSASLRFGHPELFLGKQFLSFLIGFAFLSLLASLNYQIFSQYTRELLFFSLILLLLVLLVGKIYRGTKGWFVIGPFSFQPSEISKLLVILILAGWCDKNFKKMGQMSGLIIPFLVVLSHIALILLQPDFGSALVYFPILLGILFLAGARLYHLLFILSYGLISTAIFFLHTFLSLSADFLKDHPILNTIYKGLSLGKEFLMLQLFLGLLFLFAGWFTKQWRVRIPPIYLLCAFLLMSFSFFSSAVLTHSIKEYQRKRMVAFFKPGIDPLGSGYHVIQSVVALGSGKIFGKGIFSGTQGQLGFLPEQHTDFIFSVLGEELGFMTSGFVVLLYLILIWRCIMIAGDSRDRFGSMVAIGIGFMFAFYTILNLTMTMGLAPVTGLPLPFLSYGGSSLVSSLAAVGLLLSIHVRRYTH